MILMGLQIVITLSAIILMFYVRTTEGLEFLIPSLSAELVTATGFYYKKAEKENQIKIPLIYKIIYKQLGMEYEEEKETEDE